MTNIERVARAVDGDPAPNPDLWLFAESDVSDDGRVETATAYNTRGSVSTDVVTAALASLVMKLADDTETHPAIIVMNLSTAVHKNLDAPRVSRE